MTSKHAPSPLVGRIGTRKKQSYRGFFLRALFVAALFFHLVGSAPCAPIEKIQGVISEVGEGFLLIKPDGETKVLKFILRWKARFVPPKLPLKGDRVLVLYKNKEEGALIYALHYLKTSSGSNVEQPEPAGETAGQ